MDLEGWYSVTPEYIAAQIAERCKLFECVMWKRLSLLARPQAGAA